MSSNESTDAADAQHPQHRIAGADPCQRWKNPEAIQTFDTRQCAHELVGRKDAVVADETEDLRAR